MFTIHRSERSDALVAALVELLATPLDDPFTTELVAVPTKGVERWLTHRIANAVGTSPGRRDGVCANVEFPYPGRLIGDVLATATGVARETDPWRTERLVWPLLATIDDSRHEPWMRRLGEHLGLVGVDAHTEVRQRRRYATARRLAELFDAYATYRPDMLIDWLDGGDDLPEDARWQADLWRALRHRLAVPSPAERVEEACRRIRSGDVDVDLPERLSLFGLTRLPATHLQVLRALATGRDIHAFALHPSATLWERVRAVGRPALPLRRSDDPTVDVARHPLLRSWANDTRELQLVTSEAVDAVDVHHPVDAGEPANLLEHLQRAVRHDVAPPGRSVGDRPDERIVLAPDDVSLQVHACHGRARQVDVIRDAICHALADDPSLEPRDIVVMCPDIDEFAPLLRAAFSAGSDEGLPDLPYRLADRALRQTNPLLAGLDALLSLVDGRMSAPDVVAFLGRAPVRTRFGFDDDDLDTIATWVADANVRWGLDAQHRAAYDLGDVDANTWAAGIDRVVAGIAVSGDGDPLLGSCTPVDDVESGDVDLAGRLAEAVERLRWIARRAAVASPLAEWVTLLGDAVDATMDTGYADAWQRVAVDGMLSEILDEATGAHGPAASEISLTEIRSLLDHRLRGAPTRADFRTGDITMCTLVPMRAVPHRVVCVLGLDDGRFPRTTGGDGDDVLRRLPRVGDRDPRWEDRQLLLDALMSATERFIVTTTGHDPRTNEECPPAVPLAELLDVCDRTARTATGEPASEQVVVAHPLQPFDPVEFSTGRHAGNEPWSFDRVQLRGALALGGRRRAPSRIADVDLGDFVPADGVLELADLVRFLQRPVQEFLRQRLGVATWDGDDRLADVLPLELDNLEAWAVGDRLLRSLLQGTPVDDAVAAERSRGSLPPGALGDPTLATQRARAVAVFERARTTRVHDSAESIGVDLDTSASGTGVTSVVGTVVGVVRPVDAGRPVSVTVSMSRLGARDQLAAWVRLVALTAQRPEEAWQAAHVGRSGSSAEIWTVGPLGDDEAERAAVATSRLGELVELWANGMRSPLPLSSTVACAWVRQARRGRAPGAHAAREWETVRSSRWDNEDKHGPHLRVFGGQISFDELLDFAATDAESGPGWSDHPSRFVRLAHRVWDPIFDAVAQP